MPDQTDDLQLRGLLRDEALRRFKAQIDGWGLRMPPAEPLVMAFGQGDFQSVGLIECWIANEVEAGYCGKYLFVFYSQTCPEHSHDDKHETFFVVKGKVTLNLNGQPRQMYEGDVLVMPPGQKHSFTGVGNALLLEISTPCDVNDNQFTNTAIDAWLKKAVG